MAFKTDRQRRYVMGILSKVRERISHKKRKEKSMDKTVKKLKRRRLIEKQYKKRKRLNKRRKKLQNQYHKEIERLREEYRKDREKRGDIHARLVYSQRQEKVEERYRRMLEKINE